MAREENSANASSINKVWYKVELCFLKLIPMLIALCYWLNTTLSFIGIDAPIFSYIGGMSLLPLLFVYLSSFVFGFCAYHRMFLYYVFVSDATSYYDLYIGIPMDDRTLFMVEEIATGLFMFVVLYLKIFRRYELH